MPSYLFVGGSHHLEFCSPAVARAVMVCHIFCSSLFHVGIAVFCPHSASFISGIHTAICQPHTRAGIHSLMPFHWLHFTFRGYVFSLANILVLTPYDAFSIIRFHHSAHNPFRSCCYHSTLFTHYCQSLPSLTHCSSKKMRQTSCRQHPATALCATCVRGTRSTRIGSHTTHRLNTSFRFSTLAFKPCYPYKLKAVLPRIFGLNLLLPRQPPTTHPKYKCS